MIGYRCPRCNAGQLIVFQNFHGVPKTFQCTICGALGEIVYPDVPELENPVLNIRPPRLQ